MTNKVNIDFISPELSKEHIIDVQELVKLVKSGQKVLYSFTTDNLIDLFDKFASKLLNRSNLIHRQFPNSGIPYLANWCRKHHIKNMLHNSFQDYKCIDTYVDNCSSAKRSTRAFPKGLVVHWMSGNIPILGFISLLMGIITKNTNIIKQASGSDNILAVLLNQLSEIEVEEDLNGADLLKSVAVINYDHSKREIGNFLSNEANVRIIWGGDESVKAIQGFSKNLGTSDIIFPNRTSFIIIGERTLENNLSDICKRIARDVSIFEQKACASPHTIFITTDNDLKVKAFAEELKNAMQSALKTFPKVSPSHKEISAILNLRAKYDMLYEAWYSSGIEFTILFDDLLQLGPPIGNRIVYIRKLTDFTKLIKILPPNVQTVGLSVIKNDFDKVTSILGENGVHRITSLGTMTNFELPWDGYMLPHHLVRWTSRPALKN